ncbi:MAG: hypothetical protein BRD40_02070 [Bacteroidetes bacterium QS_1_65_9]|nr:MAG: hypothetical protein BRD40_02070 [Bacteroidetes bacterium QS_1_65_9]
MPYVVTESCIDCNACVPVCPVEAIYADDELPQDQEHYIQWNEYLANQWRSMGWIASCRHHRRLADVHVSRSHQGVC